MGQAASRSGGGPKKPKQVNLFNHGSVKCSLDEFVSEVVISKGYVENVRTSNLKMLIGLISIVIAVAAHFYPRNYPQNRNFTIVCIAFHDSLHNFVRFPLNFLLFTITNLTLKIGRQCKYLASSAILLLIPHLKEKKNTILLTHPLLGSPEDTAGLMISSNLPRFTDAYTLTVASADPKSASARRPVILSKSVTKWFTEDGFLVEGLFWRDVEKLVDDYATRDLKKTDIP